MKSTLLPLTASLLLALVMSIPAASFASTTSTLFSEDFSGSTFPPDGWVDNSYYSSQSVYYGDGFSGWYRSDNGMNGADGSAVSDEWNYSGGLMETPQIDLSAYNYPADEAYLDFDLFFEKSLYHDPSQADDHFKIHFLSSSNDTMALDINSTTDYTYFYDAYDYHPDPVSDPTAWRHYHIKIPTSFHVADFQAAWESAPGQGLSNPAIDNVVVTATHYDLLGFKPTRSLDFGSFLVGDTSAVQCIYLSNPNAVPIDLSNISVANSAEFQIVYAPSSLAPGTLSNPTVDSICVMFIPTAGGSQTGSINILNTGDAPNNNITISFTGAGLAPILTVAPINLFQKTKTPVGSTRSQSFAVTNTGIGNLVISPSSFIEGEYPGEYSITRIPGPIAPGSTDSVTITFSPDMEGALPAQVSLLSNGGASEVVLLRGIGTIGRLVVSPTSFDFDSTALYTQTCQKFVLTNTGSDTVTITKDFLSSSDFDFSYTGLGADNKIAPDQTKEVTVCFTPLQNGSRFATLRFETDIPATFEVPRRDTSAIDVQIRGVGVPYGRLALGGVATDTIPVGTTVCHTDTISNTGASDLVINSASVSGTDATDFVVSGVTFPLTIAPGRSQVFNFCVTPSSRGLRTASIDINTTNGGQTQSISVPVFSVGIQVCASTNAQSLFSTAKTLVGMTDTESVVVTNCGDVPTAYTGAITAGQGVYTIAGSPVTAVVAPGQSATLSVVFAPTAVNAANGTLTITGGAGVTPMTVALGGTGAGITLQATGQPGNVMQGDCTTFDVTITNNGNIDWTPGAPTLGGTNAADYSIVSGPTPATLAAGQSGTISMKFCPTTTESESTVLSFPSATPSAGGFTYTISGTGALSGVSTETAQAGFVLGQSYPNPATASAQISFTIPKSEVVRMDLVDQKGNLVKTVLQERLNFGAHQVSIELNDLASGTYYYVLTSEDVRLSRQMVVIK